MNSCKNFPLIVNFLLLIILIHVNADVSNANSSSAKPKTHAQLVAEQRARNLEVDRQYAAKNKALKEKLVAFCKENDLVCEDRDFDKCHLEPSLGEENWCLQMLKWDINVQYHWKTNSFDHGVPKSGKNQSMVESPNPQ